MKISIIVPTYNGKKLLVENIIPLEKELQKTDVAEIVIVDNNSTDGTSELFRVRSDFFRYFCLSKNFGFTGAVNKGAEESTSDFILILNNDCKITSKTINQLVTFLSKNSGSIATQPVIQNPSGAIENIGYIVDLKKAKAETITNIEKASSHISSKNIWSEGKFYGLSAACLLIQKSTFIDIGKFDESFHSYLEDIDLFIRLNKKNFHFAPCVDASAIHAHMSTSSKMGAYKEWHDFINWIKIIFKNYPTSFVFWNSPTLFIERLRNLNGYFKKVIST
jgi:GT2 family glycosyltransferase